MLNWLSRFRAALQVVNVLEDKDRLDDLAELFQSAVERVLFGVGVQSFEKLRRCCVLEFDGGDETQDRVPMFFDQFRIDVGVRQYLVSEFFIDFSLLE